MALHPALRDALVLVAIFAVVLGGLFLYTGVWPPAVIVESGSMMHPDSEVSYGRLGTIDPGDLVIVKGVAHADDIRTQLDSTKERYGRSGDVIIYYRANDRATVPIIHRAVAYVEVVETNGRVSNYDVRWRADEPCVSGATKTERDGHAWCRYGPGGIYVPSVPIQGPGSMRASPTPYVPTASGFITKGDNPITNALTDQASGLSRNANGTAVPVDIDWVEGKSRGELPWLGLIKLAMAGKPNEDNPPRAWVKFGSAYAPGDLWVMLATSLAVLIGGPLASDWYRAIRARRLARTIPAAPVGLDIRVGEDGGVHLSWESSPGGIRSHHVYRDDARIASVAGSEYHDTSTARERVHRYSVSAVSAAGVEGPRSAPVLVADPTSGAPPGR